MSYNEEWEQIKTEYKEIPVPKNGMAQMEEAMEKAVYHRSRRRKVTAYSAIVVALLLILVLPKSFLGEFRINSSEEAENRTNGMGIPKDTTIEFKEKEVNSSALYDSIAEEIEDIESDRVTDFGVTESFGTVSSMLPVQKESGMESEWRIEVKDGDNVLSICLSKEEVKAINQEISGQMGEMVGISQEQAYYINEDGLLVVVWEEMIEFVIPKAVIFIEK